MEGLVSNFSKGKNRVADGCGAGLRGVRLIFSSFRDDILPVRSLATRWNPAWLVCAAIASAVGVFVAIRPDGVGTDTANYRSRFLRMLSDDEYSTGYEPAFDFTMKAVSHFTNSSEVFLGLVYGILLISMLAAMKNAVSEVHRHQLTMFPLAALGLLLFSSWFITGSMNGMRQGLSLGVFYLGATMILYQGKWFRGLIFVTIAPLFHLSAILLWPVVLVAPFLSLKACLALFLAVGAAYPLGLSEWAVYLFSELTKIDLYRWVIDYSPGSSHWEGWQWDLFVYTVGMAGIHLIGRLFVSSEKRMAVDIAIKIYMLLCMPYFVLGFGNFSNRYGLMAWSFLPILHVTWIFTANIDKWFRVTIAVLLLVGGTVKYSLYLSGGL